MTVLLMIRSSFVFILGRIVFISPLAFAFFRFHLLKKKKIVSVSRKAITWGGLPLVIAPYNESVGLLSFDSPLPFPFQTSGSTPRGFSTPSDALW